MTSLNFKNTYFILFFILVMFMSTSCVKTAFYNTIINAPYVANLDTVHSAQTTLQGSYNHLEIQTAYGLTNHVGVHSQFYLSRKSNYNINAGPVFYTHIKKLIYIESNFAFGQMNFYENIANNNSLVSGNADSWKASAKANTYSGQFFSAFKFRKIALGMGLKATYFDYSNFEYDFQDAYFYSASTVEKRYREQAPKQQPHGWMLETFINLSIKFGRVLMFFEPGVVDASDIKINTFKQYPKSFTVNQSIKSPFIRKYYFNTGVAIKLNVSNPRMLKGFLRN